MEAPPLPLLVLARGQAAVPEVRAGAVRARLRARGQV